MTRLLSQLPGVRPEVIVLSRQSGGADAQPRSLPQRLLAANQHRATLVVQVWNYAAI